MCGFGACKEGITKAETELQKDTERRERATEI